MTAVILTIAAVCMVLVAFWYSCGNILYYLAFGRLDKEAEANRTRNSAKKNVLERRPESISISGWNISGESVYIESRDGIKLHARAFMQKSGKWVLVAHGYRDEASEMLWAAKEFYTMGYSVLIPDARGHGGSGGNYIGMGWPERYDLLDWIEKIVDIDDDAQIVMFGWSMGGATVMMTSGENLPANVKAIVEDAGYTSVQEILKYRLSHFFKSGAGPIVYIMAGAVSHVIKRRAGYSLDKASAVNQIKKSITPTLFIHGDADLTVPVDMVYKNYESAKCEKELYILKNIAHSRGIGVDLEDYWRRVDDFISKYVRQNSLLTKGKYE